MVWPVDERQSTADYTRSSPTDYLSVCWFVRLSGLGIDFMMLNCGSGSNRIWTPYLHPTLEHDYQVSQDPVCV